MVKLIKYWGKKYKRPGWTDIETVLYSPFNFREKLFQKESLTVLGLRPSKDVSNKVSNLQSPSYLTEILLLVAKLFVLGTKKAY